jgi:hypothetical protein
MAGQRGGLGCHPFHQVAVAHDGVDVMIDKRLSRPVELGGQPALGDGHPDAGGEALSQRPRGGLDAGRVAVFRMAGGLAAPLPEPLKVL